MEEAYASKAPAAVAAAPSSASSAPKQPQKVSMLNASRSRNVELVLSRLKISNSAIVENL